MISLKIKLPLFTVVFVCVASLSILWISVYQIRQKADRDIATIRVREMSRVRSSLKEHVAIISSLIRAEHERSTPRKAIELVLDEIKDVSYDSGRGLFWIARTADTLQPVIHPFLDSVSGTDRETVFGLATTVTTLLDRQEDDYVAIDWPKLSGGALTSARFPMICYARIFRPFGWIVASSRYVDDIDGIIAARTGEVRREIAAMIRDRIILSALILLLSVIAILVFASMITKPVDRLVAFTEDITSQRRGYSERINIPSHDEIGRLARSFNTMLGHIESTLHNLEENARRYRELVENANSAIIRLDNNGKILFFNEYAQQLFGYAAEEMQGRSIAGVLEGPEVFGASSIWEFLRKPDRYLYSEGRITTKAGSHPWVGWTLRPLRDASGELREVLCVGSDISQRKETEEKSRLQQQRLIQADKMTTLGILVAGVAHEINNPNNLVVLNGENLADLWHDIRPVLDEHFARDNAFVVAGLPYREMREAIPALIQGITGGGRRIQKIVQTLKDFARLEPGDTSQSVDLRTVVDAATVIAGNLIKKSTDRFDIIAEGTVPCVRGNFQRLEQVVLNLVTNACQATADASKPITVTIREVAGGSQVALSVEDHGCGIPPDDMKHIMEPFFTTRRELGGTGLGLAISYSIVKDHGGELRIESTLGQGTTAYVVLPACPGTVRATTGDEAPQALV